MKFRVLNPITQGLRLENGAVHERQLFEGDTIELDRKEAAELIACGAIDPESIDQSNAADELANAGADTLAPITSESSGADQNNPADTSTTSGADTSAPPAAATTTKKAKA